MPTPNTRPTIQPDELELPLARCEIAGGDDWHWAATFAYPEGEIPGPHVTTWVARPDQHALDQMSAELPAHVSQRQGRYRARVMPLPLTVARALVWRAVGDPDRIHELLAPIAVIGKKRSAGHGGILDWTVTPEPGADRWDYAHLHPDGALGRTTPHRCLDGRGDVATGGAGQMGIRPPYSTRRCVGRPFSPRDENAPPLETALRTAERPSGRTAGAQCYST